MKTEKSFAWSYYLWLLGKVTLAVVVVSLGVYWLWFAPIAVQLHKVAPGEIVVEVMGTGTLEAHVKATVSTKISGRLKSVLVDQGDVVKAEQEVARLDEHDLGHEVEIEEANVTARKAGIDRLQAEIMQAKAIHDQATTNHTRVKRLITTQAASQDEMDKAIELLAVAKANLSRTEAALVEGRRQLLSTEKSLEFRKARLDDAVIRSPFDAVIVRRDRHPGDVVLPGSSILAVVSTTELWISAWVDESAMANVKPKQPARVIFRARPNQSLEGKVIRLGKETDRETREFLVDVAPVKMPQDWSIGQRAEVYIETARKQAEVVVPLQYVVWHDAQPMIFVDVNGRAEQREVKLGLKAKETVEILEGLKVNEVVVKAFRSHGTMLTNGQRVHAP